MKPTPFFEVEVDRYETAERVRQSDELIAAALLTLECRRTAVVAFHHAALVAIEARRNDGAPPASAEVSELTERYALAYRAIRRQKAELARFRIRRWLKTSRRFGLVRLAAYCELARLTRALGAL